MASRIKVGEGQGTYRLTKCLEHDIQSISIRLRSEPINDCIERYGVWQSGLKEREADFSGWRVLGSRSFIRYAEELYSLSNDPTL